MRIRGYRPADFDALREMHAAQGFGYPLPDLDSPLFVVKLVLEENENDARDERERSTPSHSREVASGREEAVLEAGGSKQEAGDAGHESRFTNHGSRIVMAVLLRLTAETYLLHDAQAGTPRQRWQNLLALHEAARHSAAAIGLDDVQAFLPPRVARAFGRRLTRLGWRRDPWTCFSRVTRG